MTIAPQLPIPRSVARAAHSALLALIALIALVAFGSAAPAANAGVITVSAEDCDAQPLSTPFLPWTDPAHYTPHPRGDFEGSLPGWDLEGGAGVVPGNEPYKVNKPDDRASLALPQGSRVTTGAICVGLGHPTMRFFFRRTGGSPVAALLVEVVFEDASGRVRRLPIGVAAASSDWTPSLPLPVVANLLPVLPGDRVAVAFRFTAWGGASWQVDDLYVDPWRAR